ncbi:hypothetical protein [uncultured Litoreibacter sp.]|uniref:hypothetical protein n=1 Tax=uncultured Litoreibacter sp. TaxID=1392394 RepID=UPI00261B35AD|nr:hypothetical protein [uncultured Litoreibacter sp.]
MSRAPRRSKARLASSVFVWIILALMLGAIMVFWLEPETEPTFVRVSIIERGTSRTSSENAARSEPGIVIELADGSRRTLPSLYYALHPELAEACMRQTTTRFSGVDKSTLIPPQNCP